MIEFLKDHTKKKQIRDIRSEKKAWLQSSNI